MEGERERNGSGTEYSSAEPARYLRWPILRSRSKGLLGRVLADHCVHADRSIRQCNTRCGVIQWASIPVTAKSSTWTRCGRNTVRLTANECWKPWSSLISRDRNVTTERFWMVRPDFRNTVKSSRVPSGKLMTSGLVLILAEGLCESYENSD